jgi:hypothetical protein
VLLAHASMGPGICGTTRIEVGTQTIAGSTSPTSRRPGMFRLRPDSIKDPLALPRYSLDI